MRNLCARQKRQGSQPGRREQWNARGLCLCVSVSSCRTLVRIPRHLSHRYARRVGKLAAAAAATAVGVLAGLAWQHEAVAVQSGTGQRARKRVIPRQRICQSRFSGCTTWKRSVHRLRPPPEAAASYRLRRSLGLSGHIDVRISISSRTLLSCLSMFARSTVACTHVYTTNIYPEPLCRLEIAEGCMLPTFLVARKLHDVVSYRISEQSRIPV